MLEVPFLEPTRLFKNIPDKITEEWFEAQLSLHFVVGKGRRMQDSFSLARTNKKADWVFFPTISMIVNLRQVKQESAPVRTPSYMPRFRMTAIRGPFWVSGWAESSNGSDRVGKLRTAAEIGKTFDAFRGTGVFARWYKGHDDYNLAFLERINVVQIGFTFGGERRPQFGL